MDLDNIWNSFLEKIKKELSPITFDTWFSDTKLLSLNNGEATVLVTYPVNKKTLSSKNYNDLIVEIFNQVTGTTFKFNYVIEEEIENNLNEDNQVIGVPTNENFETNLDSKQNFDNFMVGPSNKFAHTSALAVAEQPGKMYNPLFIYGSSGLGKTHLMHAIGNYIVENSNKKVLYITCDDFVNDFVNICRKDNKNNVETVNDFKNKYRDIDVLILDDIHNIADATKAQQEFFNTFNELHNHNKQIILSSDRSPDDIKKLEERLKTRFNWGLQVNITPPDFNLRLSIINKKIENNELGDVVPNDVKEYIASNSVGDVRKLEGALNRVFAYATMMNGSDITLDIAVEALKDYFGNPIAKNKTEQVIQIVCSHYNLSSEDLLSKKRNNEIAIPRMIAMYICRTYLNENLSKIGIQFGGKNHSTVMHGVNKIKEEILNNESLNNEIQKMIKEIR